MSNASLDHFIAMQKNTNLSDQVSLLVIDATEIISSASCFNDLILSRLIYIMIIIWRLFKMGRTRCLRSLRWTMGLGCVSVRGGTGQGWFLTPDSSTEGITHPARGVPATRCFGFCGQWSTVSFSLRGDGHLPTLGQLSCLSTVQQLEISQQPEQWSGLMIWEVRFDMSQRF